MNNTTKLVLALAAGMGIGYLVGAKQVEERYRLQAENEIQEMREHFEKESKDIQSAANDQIEAHQNHVVNSMNRAQKAEAALQDYQARHAEDDLDPENLEGLEVISGPVEVAPVEHEQPFVISSEDFLSSPFDYTQDNLTWYEGDNTLADEQDNIQDEGSVQTLVGDCLRHFASTNGDELYVRNHRLHMEFEIIRHKDSYAKVVAGLGDA